MILKPAEPPCRLNQYAVLADRDDFLAGCAELMSAVRHLREMELPTVENIL